MSLAGRGLWAGLHAVSWLEYARSLSTFLVRLQSLIVHPADIARSIDATISWRLRVSAWPVHRLCGKSLP